MSEMRLIDAKELWNVQLSNKAWESNYDRITAMNIINTAPTVPAVPLADHERMKRELYSDINAFQSMARGLAIQLNRVTAERNQAVEDLRKVSSCATCKFNSNDLCRQAENDEDFQKHREAHERWNSCKGSAKLNWQWRGVTGKQTLSATVKNNILNDFMKGVE